MTSTPPQTIGRFTDSISFLPGRMPRPGRRRYRGTRSVSISSVSRAVAFVTTPTMPRAVPAQELPRVLGELHAAIKPGGVLFSSNPHGANEEVCEGGRFGAYHDLQSWRRYLTAARFTELHHYYRPDGLPRPQQPWLATAWRA